MNWKPLPYDRNNLLLAVAAVKNGMRYKEAASRYEVPYTTLHDKVNEKYKKTRKGPATTLSEEQEQRLANYLLYMAKIGYGFIRKDIPKLVKEVFDSEDQDRAKRGLDPTDVFGESHTPSMTWVYRFLSRWPELSMRLPEKLGYQREAVTEGSIRRWFASLKQFLKDEHNITAEEFLTPANAERIFNLDESGFPLSGTNSRLKIVAAKGSSSVFKLGSDSKEQVNLKSNLLNNYIYIYHIFYITFL